MKLAAIMPTYNQAQFVEEAYASLRDQVEWLVAVDDGSTDSTRETLARILAPGHVKSGHYANLGTAGAINTGFANLPDDADWVTWVSSDNIHEPNYVEALAEMVTPTAGVVYSAYHRWDPERGTSALQSTPYNPKRLISQEACYFGPSFAIRRDVWERAGPHRGKISHDYDHWTRVEEACWEMGLDIVHQPKSLCRYRVHDERVTVTRRHQYDAGRWRQLAVLRRASSGETPGGE